MTDEEKAEESYMLYRDKNCAVSRNAHSHHLHKDWRESGIDRHKAYTDGYLAGLAEERGAHNCQEDALRYCLESLTLMGTEEIDRVISEAKQNLAER